MTEFCSRTYKSPREQKYWHTKGRSSCSSRSIPYYTYIQSSSNHCFTTSFSFVLLDWAKAAHRRVLCSNLFIWPKCQYPCSQGTWAGECVALKRLIMPLLVWPRSWCVWVGRHRCGRLRGLFGPLQRTHHSLPLRPHLCLEWSGQCAVGMALGSTQGQSCLRSHHLDAPCSCHTQTHNNSL